MRDFEEAAQRFIDKLPKSLKKFWLDSNENNFVRLIWSKKNRLIELTYMDDMEVYFDKLIRNPSMFLTENISDLTDATIIKEIKDFLNYE